MRPLWIIAGVLGLLLLHAGLLAYMGQPLMYEGGYIKLWHGVVISGENSQHLSDWYTLSHIIHGILFYALLAFLFPRMSIAWRLFFAIGIEMDIGRLVFDGVVYGVGVLKLIIRFLLHRLGIWKSKKFQIKRI